MGKFGSFVRGVGASILALVLSSLLGCLTPRSEFSAVDEVMLVSAEKSSDPYSWETDERWKAILAVMEEGKKIFRFLSSGQTTLLESVVGDFRMEFSVRLEAKVEYEIATAMINFRNYFDRRYCLIVEPDTIRLAAARGSHSNLVDLVRFQTSVSLGVWNNYEIVAVGARIKVFRNGLLIIDAEDKGSVPWQGNIVFESHSKYSISDVSLAKIGDFVKNEPPKPSAALPPAVAALKEKLTVAVSGFEAQGVEAHKASLLTDLYSTALLSTGVFRVMDRSQLAKILTEQELQLSEVSDSKTAVTIGGLMNAEYLSTGSIGMLGNQYVVTVRIVRVKTGETLVSVQKNYTDVDKIPGEIAVLCAEIAKKILSN